MFIKYLLERRLISLLNKNSGVQRFLQLRYGNPADQRELCQELRHARISLHHLLRPSAIGMLGEWPACWLHPADHFVSEAARVFLPRFAGNGILANHPHAEVECAGKNWKFDRRGLSFLFCRFLESSEKDIFVFFIVN